MITGLTMLLVLKNIRRVTYLKDDFFIYIVIVVTCRVRKLLLFFISILVFSVYNNSNSFSHIIFCPQQTVA